MSACVSSLGHVSLVDLSVSLVFQAHTVDALTQVIKVLHGSYFELV